MRMRGVTAVLAAALLLCLGSFAWAQGACPGGESLTGFRLLAGPRGGGPMLPLTRVNQLHAGDMLWYLPHGLPLRWRRSARVAILLVPSAEDAANILVLRVHRADRPAGWTVPEPAAAVALLFGPRGFNAGTIRKLAAAHPELIRNFIDYASQATRVEALVALLSRYEHSRPGSIKLQTLLHRYSERYGVQLPKVNPAQPPEETAAELLHAVAPPTAMPGASPHAALTAGSQSAAAAVASLYFAPLVGVATSSVPLVKALHGMMFPGTAFRGAFAVPGETGQSNLALCTTNAARQPHKRLAYVWMARIPGDAPPAIRLLHNASVPAAWQAQVHVTCDSVAQLRALMRVHQWALAGGGHRYFLPVDVASVGVDQDTLKLDLRQASVPPGRYQLSATWDWTPVLAQGTVTVRPAPALAAARLAPHQPDLISGGGTVPLRLTGADFSLVRSVTLTTAAGSPPGRAAAPLAVPLTHPSRSALGLRLDTQPLAPGAYTLHLRAANGETAAIPLTVLPPNPTLTGLPLTVHLGASRPTIWLRGEQLAEITRITSPGATWTLGPAPNPAAKNDDADRRAVTIAPQKSLQAGQKLPATLYLAGRKAPITIADAIRIAPPLPVIRQIQQASFRSPIALRPGELPAATMVSFSVAVAHAGDNSDFRLSCRGDSDDDLALQPGVPARGGAAQVDDAGEGLYYLAFQPGRVGNDGCQIELQVTSPTGDSIPKSLGRIVRLPTITGFQLGDHSAGPGQYRGTLTGSNLQLIAATGWNRDHGVPITAVPAASASGNPGAQRLRIAMPWPPPSPHAPLYIWLRGEPHGRKTSVRFQ